MVSRAGSDLSEEYFKEYKDSKKKYKNIIHKYTHAGLVYKDPKRGKWIFKHLLNICQGPKSGIFVQGLAEFFSDDPHFYDAKVSIPTLDLQEKLYEILTDEEEGDLDPEKNMITGGWAKDLHNKKNSSIANPFRTKYFNSNMWVLVVIAAAEGRFFDYKSAQKFYEKNGYKPSKVYLGAGRLWGKLFDGLFAGNKNKPNAHIDDHSQKEEGRTGWYNWVSDVSIERYLKRKGLRLSTTEISHPRGENIPTSELNRF